MATSVHAIASHCLRVVFGLYIVGTLLLLLAYAPSAEYACKSSYIHDGFAFLIAAIIVGFAVLGICAIARERLAVEEHSKKRLYRAFVSIGFVVLIVAQCIVVNGGMFLTGWDVEVLTDFGNYNDHASYYSQYTNQWFLAGLFDLISGIGSFMGVEDGYLCLLIAGCAIVDASVLMSTYVAKALFGRLCSCLLFVFECIYVGLSPWILVPYSDTFSLGFTTAILFFYVCCKKPFVKWPGILFFSIIGFAIKPTVVFALFAIVIVEGVGFIDECRLKGGLDIRNGLKGLMQQRCILLLATVVIAVLIASSIVSAVSIDEDDFDYDSNLSFGMTHFLMMGFNPDTLGVWSEDDVGLSSDAKTVEERRDANMSVFFERVDAYGPVGVLKLFAKKSMSNLGDGTLAWEKEGAFYAGTIGTSETIKSVYGIDDVSESKLVRARDPLFAPIAFVVWFAILLGLAFSLIPFGPRKEVDVLRLSLLALLMFLMVFECRARYLLLYMPYFMILALGGWRAVYCRIQNLVSNSNKA